METGSSAGIVAALACEPGLYRVAQVHNWPKPDKRTATKPLSTYSHAPALRRHRTIGPAPSCDAQLARDSEFLLGLKMRCQPGRHVLEILGQVSVQCLAHRRRAARLGRLDESEMPSVRLVECDWPSVIHESYVAVGDIHQSLRQTHRMRTCGRAQQDVVKLMMRIDIPQVSTLWIRHSEELTGSRGALQLFIGVVPSRTPGEINFDEHSESVDLHQLFEAQRGYDRPAPRAQRDQTVRLQPSERLPNRDMADVHLCRQFPDRELLARTQNARDDRAFDLPCNPLNERRCCLRA